MTKIITLLLMGSLLVGCNGATHKTAEKNDRQELVPEPDRAERLKYEALEGLKRADCFLTNPDTSICGIEIRDPQSVTVILGDNNVIDSSEQYHFYSRLDRETLTLTQHPGDGTNSISIFSVQYSNKADYGYRQLPIDTFKSEKGIKLGISKQQITNRLGNCYAALDSTKGYIELYYRLELPKDSKTQLLQRHNMPIYYASYKLWNDRLEKFEFGFEYP